MPAHNVAVRLRSIRRIIVPHAETMVVLEGRGGIPKVIRIRPAACISGVWTFFIVRAIGINHPLGTGKLRLCIGIVAQLSGQEDVVIGQRGSFVAKLGAVVAFESVEWIFKVDAGHVGDRRG